MIGSFKGEYFFLSNFYDVVIDYEGITYPSTEHAYQAAKSPFQAIKFYASKINTPGKVKRFGRGIDLRPDWEEVKIREMRNILEIKFAIPELREKLLATGTEVLFEGNNWGDVFWGQCPLGSGRNELGILLMSIRNDIAMFG